MNSTDKPNKRIFLFSDGTGNAAWMPTKTNVWRIYQALEKDGARLPRQVALYDNGVGSSTFAPLRLLLGIFGIGLRRNVLDLYRFLCLQYEPGAEIYLIGFSRGAFTMRLLAAMVGRHGIIKVRPAEDGISPRSIDSVSNRAYNLMSDEFHGRSPFVRLGRAVRELFSRKTFEGKRFDELPRHDSREIEFMGLFDTVSAIGGPIQELAEAFSILFWPTEPKDLTVQSHVKKVCHALALDEPRQSFSPKLINEAKNPLWNDPRLVPELEEGTRIEQVWFAGAHGNVGGGYANDGLAMVPLNWMIEKLRYGWGVRFDTRQLDVFAAAEDCCAPIHDPRDGWGFIYRYDPRNLSRLTEDTVHHVYTGKPKIHTSVRERIRRNPDYAPIAITRNYELVDRVIATRDFSDWKEDHVLFEAESEAEGAQGANDTVVEKATKHNPLFTGLRYNPHIEAAWDQVWFRRIVIAIQIFFILLFLAAPFRLDTQAKAVCEEVTCFLQEPVRAAQSVLPAPFHPMADAFVAHPDTMVSLLVIVLLLIAFGRALGPVVNTALTDYWHYVAGTRTTPPPTPKRTSVSRMRRSNLYRLIVHTAKRKAFIFFFGMLLLGAVSWAFNQGILYVRDRSLPMLATCSASKAVGPEFSLTDTCYPTGQAAIVIGRRYRLTITPTTDTNGSPLWRDWFVKATPNGLPDDFLSRLTGFFASSWKRHPTKPLFAPILRINDRFPTLQKLQPLRAVTRNGEAAWETEFTATASGLTYFYVNDVHLALLPAGWQLFYRNNEGGGTVTVECISENCGQAAPIPVQRPLTIPQEKP